MVHQCRPVSAAIRSSPACGLGNGAGRAHHRWQRIYGDNQYRGRETTLPVELGGVVHPIPGLFNTGVGANGTVLASGAVDPHWQLILSADAGFPGPSAIVVNDSGFPDSTLADQRTSLEVACPPGQSDRGQPPRQLQVPDHLQSVRLAAIHRGHQWPLDLG